MKTSILQSLKNLWQGTRPKPPTVSQMGIQARAIRHLITTGWIDARTVLNMGTNDANKMFVRLRRLGLLFDHADPAGHVWLDNHSGHGRYKRHRWTGKLPANWETGPRQYCTPVAGSGNTISESGGVSQLLALPGAVRSLNKAPERRKRVRGGK